MRTLIRVVVIVVVLAAGILAGFGYERNELQKLSKIDQDKLNDANKKLAAMQKKYTDEKTLHYSTEMQKKSALEDGTKVRKENVALTESIKELEAKVSASEEQNKGTEEKLAAFRADLEAVRKKFDEAAQVVREKEAEIKRFSAEQQALQANLAKHQERLERSEANNAKLCVVAEELLEKYKNKGVFTALSQSEPLTQLKKVELEKLVQEYSQLIEQDKVKKQDK